MGGRLLGTAVFLENKKFFMGKDIVEALEYSLKIPDTKGRWF